MVEIRKITKQQFESGVVDKPGRVSDTEREQTTIAQTPKSSGVKMRRLWVNLDQVTEYRPENTDWDRD